MALLKQAKLTYVSVEMSLAVLLRISNNLVFFFFANVTQLAERQPSKLEVAGSNPAIRFETI